MEPGSGCELDELTSTKEKLISNKILRTHFWLFTFDFILFFFIYLNIDKSD